MALKEYTLTTVTGTETTVQLDAADAERYGDRVKPLSRGRKSAVPANKAAVPANKSTPDPAAATPPAAGNG